MFPSNSLDKISIQGKYEDNSSEALDKLIVQDIEKIIQNNQNLENIITVITNGTYHIIADIKDSSFNQKTVDNIKNEITFLKRDLPTLMNLPYVSIVDNFFPLLNISISSKINKNYVEVAKELEEELKKIKNLHEVKLTGDFDSILSIKLNKEILQAYNISIKQSIQAFKKLFLLENMGKLKTKKDTFYVGFKNEEIQIKDILESKIQIGNSLLYIKDLASINYTYKKQELINKTDSNLSVVLNIKKAKTGDSIQLSKDIRKVLKEYKTKYKDIDFKVLSDSSFWIQTRLNVISSNIIIGLILLFIAIWVFISLKIALVVILGIPISFAFGFIGMDFFDSSLNTLSMIAVLLSLGILVDEAIVVSENIHRHKLLGKDTISACIDGTAEVMSILFASLLTTIIAFLPLTMLSGGLGLFIKIIPIMVIILIISSFIESFIFLPLHYKLLDKFLKDNNKEGYREKIWKTIILFYKKSLFILMKRKYISSFLIVFLTLFGIYFLIKQSSFQLFPEFDAMSINITGKVKNNSLSFTLKETKELEETLLKSIDKKDLASSFMIIGMNSDGRSQHKKGENLFTIRLNLEQKKPDDFFNKYINPIFTPYEDINPRTRTLQARELVFKIKKLLESKNLIKNFLEFKISIPQTGVVKNDIELLVSSKDNKKTKEALDLLSLELKKIKVVSSVIHDMTFDNSFLQFELSSYGKSLGFTQEIINKRVKYFLNMNKIGKIVDSSKGLIELNLEFKLEDKLSYLKNLSLQIPNQTSFIKLSSISIFKIKKEITIIKKENLKRVFTLSASLEKKKLSSRAFYKKIKVLLDKLKKDGIDIIIKGEEKTNEQIKKDILISFVLCIFGILIVLTILFNSFLISLFALSVIPLSFFGVLLGHFILSTNITFSSLLGYIGLIGIVMNDTLIVLKFIHKSENKESLVSQASIRVRPVLLTSITTILGLTMLIFFPSGESLLMQPLGISIGFGLLFATLINLYYLPLVFSFLKRYN